MDSEGGDDGDERDERPAPQPERSARRERPRRDDNERPRRDENERPIRDEKRPPAPRRATAERGNGDAMPFDALPPAIGGELVEAPVQDDNGEEEVRRPRRRTRAARPAEGDDDIAPAA
jgi:hypothetical protein